MRKWLAALLLLVLVTPVWGAQRRVTLYLDGAVVEEQLPAHRGYAEVELPAAMQPGSLRVRPSGLTVIKDVDIVSAKNSKNPVKQLARLTERKEWLTDRLKGLETREEIFRAAAKAQSAKAPRKTKNNPEPLASIRQGTNLALTQLEEVFRQQRLTRRELAETESHLGVLDERKGSQGSMARITFAGKGKSGAWASYIRTDLFWTPRYDFRLVETAGAQITIRPLVPAINGKAIVELRFARFADEVAEKSVPVMPLPAEPIRLPVKQAVYRGGPGSSLKFTVANTGPYPLPPGQASCYWQGEFLGSISFAGCGVGDTCEVVVGNVFSMASAASP